MVKNQKSKGFFTLINLDIICIVLFIALIFLIGIVFSGIAVVIFYFLVRKKFGYVPKKPSKNS